MVRGDFAVSDGRRILIDVPLRTPLLEIETEVMRQAVALCAGNVARAARCLDVGGPRVARRMKRLARTENEAATETGDGGSAIPSFPGGQEEKSTVDS